VRVGRIRAGGIARAQVAAYREIEDVEVVALCDPVPGRAGAPADGPGLAGAATLDDHRALLAHGVDAVSVCTPHAAHRVPTVDAMAAGAHVLIGRPMATGAADAAPMARAARGAGRVLGAGFQERHDPGVVGARQVVASGDMGDIYCARAGGGRRRKIRGGSFVRRASAGAGAVADIGCYALDLFVYLLGFPGPLSVTAATSARLGRDPAVYAQADAFAVEDFAAAFVRFEGGLILLGTRAGMRLTAVRDKGVRDEGVAALTLLHDVHGRPAQTELALPAHRGSVFADKVRAFVQAARGAGPPPVPGEEGLVVQATIDAILRSAALGREVPVEVPAI